MPLAYRIEHEKRLIVAAGYGILTDDDVFGHEREISARADTVGYDELIDVTHVTRIALPSPERVRDLAAEAAAKDESRGSSKIAIVAPGDFAYGLGRMFQTRRALDSRSKTAVGVFRTMAEALAFLEIDTTPTLPTPK
jgi:hypothetical protein